MSAQFVHLRVHSEYSLRDGLLTVEQLVERCLALAMPAVALTDHVNMFAAVKFFTACAAAGIKPILGADVWVQDEVNAEPFRLALLAQNEQGYRNLVYLVSQAYLEPGRSEPLLRTPWLHERHAGLIVLSGGRDGDIGKALSKGRVDLAKSRLSAWQTCFGDRFYLELMRTGRQREEDHLHEVVALAEQCQCAVVATNDVCFSAFDDFEAHETRVCIHDGEIVGDLKRIRRYSPEQYLKSSEQMCELFADIPEALANSVEIARRCSVELSLGKSYLPNYPVPEGETLETYFDRLSREGLERRFDQLVPDGDLQKRAPYSARLEQEIVTIKQMGFAGYFLIVMEFINWAKQNGIPVGPGRGSGAGSLVAYALGITDLDPLSYDLFFERFLNPERVSLPDFDVDFCQDGRDRVIAHVAERYGQEAVSQIITFGSMAAKAVVRDVARAQGKPYGLADRIAKLIPFELKMTLEKAISVEAELKNLVETNEDVAEIWEMALKLEGLVRNVGKHAAGVVIAPTRLTDFVPVATDAPGGHVLTQFDMVDVEQVGLVKFDFLGLRTLTIIDWAVKGANAELLAKGEPTIDIARIPLDDSRVFALLKRADTAAIFQLESRGMRDLIRRLQPDVFEDIIALVALYRPGPMDLIPEFIERKHGRSRVSYLDPRMEPILRPTYGVMVYQEQVMQIAQLIGGYTLGGADLLRRAMGKKKPEEMAQQRQRFVAGAVEREVSDNRAGEIFDHMEKFAGYGFNKSHSAGYALLSYQTAWLKAHYPAHFMAAVLSGDMDNTDKLVPMVDECRRMGLTLLPPDINLGAYRFTVKNDSVLYGLGAVKGVGASVISLVIEERERGGSYRSLEDFCGRLSSARINKRALEALVRAGAFDGLSCGDVGVAEEKSLAGLSNEQRNRERARHLAHLPVILQSTEQSSRDSEMGIVDLFGEATGSRVTPQVPFRALSNRERIEAEKESLGLYLSGHPIEEYAAELSHLVSSRLNEVVASRRKQTLAGLLVSIRVSRNKRGDALANIVLDDRSGRMEATLFADVYAKERHKLTKDAVLVIEGLIEDDEFTGNPRVRVEQVFSMGEARARYADELRIGLTVSSGGDDHAERLQRLLQPFRRAGCPVCVDISSAQGSGVVRLGTEWQVEPNDALLANLREQYGEKSVRLIYARTNGD